MRLDLMEILVCAVCRGNLHLAISAQEEDEIVEGTLTCKECGEVFPIEDTIPNMLPPALRR